jgi:hypothetical protein
MKKVWLVVAGLGLIYVVMWAGMKQSHPKVKAPGVIEPTVALIGDAKGLADIAQGDAISRTAPDAQISIASITPAKFRGDDLKQVTVGDKNAKSGYVIVLDAKRDGKTIDKFTYHAVPPNQTVFVKQEPVR